MDADDLAIYIRHTQPSPEAQAIIRLTDRDHSESTPFWLFCELAVRLRRAATWIATRAVIEDKLKRTARVGLATLVANVVLVVGYAAHRLEQADGRAWECRRRTSQTRAETRVTAISSAEPIC